MLTILIIICLARSFLIVKKKKFFVIINSHPTQSQLFFTKYFIKNNKKKTSLQNQIQQQQRQQQLEPKFIRFYRFPFFDKSFPRDTPRRCIQNFRLFARHRPEIDHCVYTGEYNLSSNRYNVLFLYTRQ